MVQVKGRIYSIEYTSKERRSHSDEYYYIGLMFSKNDMVYGRKLVDGLQQKETLWPMMV